MSASARSPMPQIARAAWIIGFIAAILALAASLLLHGDPAITALRIGAGLAIVCGVIGLVTGLLSRHDPAGRTAAIASAVLLVIVVAFFAWSTPVALSTAPAG